MKLDIQKYPIGSIERAKEQFAECDLVKGLKTCRIGNIPLESLIVQINICSKKLLNTGAIGNILSAYYEYGEFGKYTVDELLAKMYEKKDYPGFLKQAYRFGKYKRFENEIGQCLKWHQDKNLPDATAWQVKFQKLREQEVTKDPSLDVPINILDEDNSVRNNKNIYLELRPIKKSIIPKIDEDPVEEKYFLSQVSKNKLEKANKLHSSTLKILTDYFVKLNYQIKETKLIDAFTVIKDKKIIFEIKSINETNEREQVRHAISQLYEYRFLYSLKDAILCIVFSQKLFSQWLVEYLENDRKIKVLWIHNGILLGDLLKEIL